MSIKHTAALAALLLVSATPFAQAADKPTDPQIAHIAYTAGTIDVEAGKQALKMSHNATVREFAQQMVRDHQAVNAKALALVKKLKVTPDANATSAVLVSAVGGTATTSAVAHTTTDRMPTPEIGLFDAPMSPAM